MSSVWTQGMDEIVALITGAQESALRDMREAV